MLSRRGFMGLASFPTAALVISRLAPQPLFSAPVPCLPAEFQEVLDDAGVTLIAGTSGAGRTATAAYIACHVAYGLQRRVLWLSLDELAPRVAHRVAALRRGLFPENWSMHPDYTDEQSGNLHPLDIRDDWDLLRWGNLFAYVRSLPPNLRPALVVVDGLGGSIMKRAPVERRPQSADSFLRGSDGWGIALAMGIPTICTMHVRRDWEIERPNLRPTMAELLAAVKPDCSLLDEDLLWGCSALGRVWLLYRDELFNRDSPDRGAIEIAMHQQPLEAPLIRKYDFDDLMTGLPLNERA